MGELPRSQPVRMDSLKAEAAEKAAPEAANVDEFARPGLETASGAENAAPKADALSAEIAADIKPAAEQAHRFNEEMLKLDDRSSVKLPAVEIDAPSATRISELFSMPSYGGGPKYASSQLPSPPQARVEVEAAPVTLPSIERQVAELPRDKKEDEARTESFTPSREVFEKVDERIVEQEKAAVRELVDAPDAEELSKFVNLAVVSASADGWTYFKVIFTPRHDLQTVPKDFVVLIDASGSIGKDRINSIRGALRRILRSATNTGDRFNLVAFRDRYSYAFKSWQECTETSFARSDKWLSNVAAHGRTDVFATIRSVLTLPRTPERPLIALVITDGEANSGVSSTAQILSKFTALNDGLVSVYMYGVRSGANRELIDILTRGNRGESFIFDGSRWRAGSAIEALCERFRDPVLSDLRVVFSSTTQAQAYPLRLKNLYRGGTLELVGRVPAGIKEVAFSIKGLNGRKAYEGFFRLPLRVTDKDRSIVDKWHAEREIDRKLR
jgi:hypothetical protein